MTGLVSALRAVAPDTDDTVRRRAEYSSDASNYRHVPVAVVCPADADQLAAAVAVACAHAVPVTMRGAGTSVAGNAIGPGVVIDCARRMNAVLEVNPDARTARVQPGVVLDALQAAAAPHGLRFGPDPSTHSRATLGGMIGNNACGSHSIAWGRTVDNVLDLDVLLADGTRLTVGTEAPPSAGRAAGLHRAMRVLTDRHGDAIRSGLDRFPRQASGYGLHHLLPERGTNLARALVGSEGTCAVLLAATVALVPVPRERALLVLAFDDLADAADVGPAVVALGPLTCEGLDTALLPPGADPSAAGLPAGRGWLLCEFDGAEAAHAAAARFGRAAVLTDPAARAAVWRVREDGAGLATRLRDGTRGGTQTCPGLLQAGRANSGCWFTDSQPDTVAHEFGHLLGANDEYQLPGSVAEIPADKLAGLSEEDKKLTTMTGIQNDEQPAGASPVAPLPAQTGGYSVTGLMGLHSKEHTEVKGRHIRLLVNAFNASLPPGTPPYQIKKL